MVLLDNEFHCRISKQKAFINKTNRANRVKFGKEYINKDNAFRNKVIFSDESKYNIFGSDGCYLWRKPNSEMKVKILRKTRRWFRDAVRVYALNDIGNRVFIDDIVDKLNIFEYN